MTALTQRTLEVVLAKLPELVRQLTRIADALEGKFKDDVVKELVAGAH